MEFGILLLITSLLSTILIIYLNKFSKSKISLSEDNNYHLKINKFYLYTGIVLINAGIIISMIILLTPGKNFTWEFSLISFIIIGGFGFIIVFSYKNHLIKFDSEKIEVTNIFAKKKLIYWNQLKSAKFSNFTNFISLKDNKDTKVKVHQHIVGLNQLLLMMESKTNIKKESLKLPFR